MCVHWESPRYYKSWFCKPSLSRLSAVCGLVSWPLSKGMSFSSNEINACKLAGGSIDTFSFPVVLGMVDDPIDLNHPQSWYTTFSGGPSSRDRTRDRPRRSSHASRVATPRKRAPWADWNQGLINIFQSPSLDA